MARDLGHRHQRSLRRLSRNVCRVFSVILRKAWSMKAMLLSWRTNSGCKLSIQSCCMPLVVTGRSVSKSRKDHPVGRVSFLWSKGLDAASEEVCLWCLFSDNDWDKQFGGYIVCMVSCCMDASRGRKQSVGRRPGGVIEDVIRALLPVLMSPTHVFLITENLVTNWKGGRLTEGGKARFCMLEPMSIGSR